MNKVISTAQLSDTLHLAECKDGFWLHDKTRGMNLSMRAKSSTDALVEALTYYQGRLAEVEQAHKSLATKVDAFIAQFADDED